MQSPKASKRDVAKATSLLDQCVLSVNGAHERITAVEEARVRGERFLQAQVAAVREFQEQGLVARLRWMLRGT